MIETPALWVAIAAMVPLMLYTAWSDVTELRIPNWIPLAALGIYCVIGLWGLPFELFLWGLGAGFGVLAFFFALYALLDMLGAGGNIGGGDVKLISALVPFISWHDALVVLVIYTVSVIALAIVFTVLWRRNAASSWASLQQQGRRYRRKTAPMGVSIAATMIAYLCVLGYRAAT
ncbi:MAG: prepilin peptidase [Pseudomonadota bacterium]